MKYTNLSKKFGDIALRVIYVIGILAILAAMVFFIYVEHFVADSSPLLSLMWIILLPVFGVAINRIIGIFFGDRYYNTGIVHEGNSIIDVAKTPKFYSRTMFMCFIECILFVVLLIRYIFLLPISILWSVVGIVLAIIGIIIFYIVGMSCYEESSIRSHIAIEKKAKAQKKSSKKFKFSKYPDLLEKYNRLKQCSAYKYKVDTHDKKQSEQDREDAFDALALAIYDIFNDIQPDLTIKKTGDIVSWQDVINKPFSELDYMEKVVLVRLLDRLYKYVLPDKYYEE